MGNLTMYVPVRVPRWLGDELTRIAEVEARRDGSKPNLSATARRALAAYVRRRSEGDAKQAAEGGEFPRPDPIGGDDQPPLRGDISQSQRIS